VCPCYQVGTLDWRQLNLLIYPPMLYRQSKCGVLLKLAAALNPESIGVVHTSQGCYPCKLENRKAKAETQSNMIKFLTLFHWEFKGKRGKWETIIHNAQ
jgi:hypothetical protein